MTRSADMVNPFCKSRKAVWRRRFTTLSYGKKIGKFKHMTEN